METPGFLYIVYNFITVKSSIKPPGGLFISGPFEGRGGLIERGGLINFVPIEEGGIITRRRRIWDGGA